MSLNIYILAGGKSSRMGEEKGLIMFRGKPMIQHVIDEVKTINKPIYIVTSNQAYAKFGYPLIEDYFKELGPAGGIDTVLQHSNETKNLVIACDMPFIDTTSISTLIKVSDSAEIVVPIYNDYPEALFAIYATSIANRWHSTVKNGVLKLSDLLSLFETKFVDGNQMCKLNPKLFCNINTKNDLNAL